MKSRALAMDLKRVWRCSVKGDRFGCMKYQGWVEEEGEQFTVWIKVDDDEWCDLAFHSCNPRDQIARDINISFFFFFFQYQISLLFIKVLFFVKKKNKSLVLLFYQTFLQRKKCIYLQFFFWVNNILSSKLY